MTETPEKLTWILAMEMLARLHELGYQRLRLSCGISPTGLNWRYSVAPVEKFEANGYMLREGYYPGEAFGSTSGLDTLFMWGEVQGLSPDELAQRFLDTYPTVAAAGQGNDPAYARWFAEALERCRPDGALVMYGEYVDAAAEGKFQIRHDKWMTLPPVLQKQARGPD